MTRCLVTVTRAELVEWTEVILQKATGRSFNEQCLWMGKQSLVSTVDYVYIPGGRTRARESQTDVFRFKNPGMATLFKLTFG